MGYSPKVFQRLDELTKENAGLRLENVQLRQDCDHFRARAHNLGVVLAQPDHKKDSLITQLTQDINRVMMDNSIMQANCVRLQAARDIVVAEYRDLATKDKTVLMEEIVNLKAKYSTLKSQILMAQNEVTQLRSQINGQQQQRASATRFPPPHQNQPQPGPSSRQPSQNIVSLCHRGREQLCL